MQQRRVPERWPDSGRPRWAFVPALVIWPDRPDLTVFEARRRPGDAVRDLRPVAVRAAPAGGPAAQPARTARAGGVGRTRRPAPAEPRRLPHERPRPPHRRRRGHRLGESGGRAVSGGRRGACGADRACRLRDVRPQPRGRARAHSARHRDHGGPCRRRPDRDAHRRGAGGHVRVHDARRRDAPQRHGRRPTGASTGTGRAGTVGDAGRWTETATGGARPHASR